MSKRAVINLPQVSARFVDGHAANETLTTGEELGIRRALLVGTPGAEKRYASVWSELESIEAARFFAAEPHCPVEVVEACRIVYRQQDCDGVVAIGGGSTLGLGKILSAEEAASFIALPTTYSGSEMTAIFGRKIDGRKKTAIDPACRPDCVIYDSELSAGLPRHESVTSAMNSIAHAVEALYPQTPNSLAATLAAECLRAHRNGLEELVFGKNETRARGELLYGAFLGGLVVGMCGIALHHQLCHVIGGLFDLPHAESNSVVLPQALDYNREFIPDANAIIVNVFGGDSAASGLFDFAQKLGAPVSLREIGMPGDGIDAVVDTMLAHGGYNPRALDAEPLLATVQAAYEGTRPD